MTFKDKLFMNRDELLQEGPLTIVAFGDSITHGAVGEGEIDYESVYWNRLRKKILNIRNYVPINVINAGIGGISANGSLARLEKQVLRYHPDLIIICFGLNDVNGELSTFLSALKIIFEKCKSCGATVVYMTPNMLNTYVAEDTPQKHLEYAKKTADMQISGKMDLFIDSAIKLAKEMEILVCNCYHEWKELSQTKDTTLLLANRINHPIREMHELFAQMLFNCLFPNLNTIRHKENDSVMY